MIIIKGNYYGTLVSYPIAAAHLFITANALLLYFSVVLKALDHHVLDYMHMKQNRSVCTLVRVDDV